MPGRIPHRVERGDHDTLLSEGGVYASMWNRQREADEARETLERAQKERLLPLPTAPELLPAE